MDDKALPRPGSQAHDAAEPQVEAAIREAATRIPGVVAVKAVGTWRCDQGLGAAVTIGVDGASTIAAGHAIAQDVRGALLGRHGLADVAVHVEPHDAASGPPHSHDGHRHEAGSYDGHRHDASGRPYYGPAEGVLRRPPDIGHSH